jgi:hypothetical protein
VTHLLAAEFIRSGDGLRSVRPLRLSWVGRGSLDAREEVAE